METFYKICHESLVEPETVDVPPAKFKLWERVWYHTQIGYNLYHPIPAIIAGITVLGTEKVKYDLLFKIDGHFYARVNEIDDEINFEGGITKIGMNITVDEEGGSAKPMLTLVKKE